MYFTKITIQKVVIIGAIVTVIVAAVYLWMQYVLCPASPTEYIRQGSYKRAIVRYTIEILKDPDNANLYYNRGVVYMKDKQFQNAIKDYEKALKLNKNAIYYQNKALAHFYLGQYDKSIEENTNGLKLFPKSGMLYYNRGRAYYMKGEMANALVDFKKAYTLGIEPARGYIENIERIKTRR
ncbi:MAG: tetratricopeptide repeat protein [Spirochaetes bacterium]|nr:tetratricopeptide repeat protein [Spirochaetota bacterium]